MKQNGAKSLSFCIKNPNVFFTFYMIPGGAVSFLFPVFFQKNILPFTIILNFEQLIWNHHLLKIFKLMAKAQDARKEEKKKPAKTDKEKKAAKLEKKASKNRD